MVAKLLEVSTGEKHISHTFSSAGTGDHRGRTGLHKVRPPRCFFVAPLEGKKEKRKISLAPQHSVYRESREQGKVKTPSVRLCECGGARERERDGEREGGRRVV